MFVHNFNHALKGLPTPEDGHEAFMAQLTDQDTVLTPATEFLTHMLRYAAARAESAAPPAIPTRVFMIAFAIARFPVELLHTPEQPLEMTLLNKTNTLMGAVAEVIRQHNPDADRASDDFLPKATALQFGAAIEEYRAAFAEWRRVDEERMRAALQAVMANAVAAAAMEMADEEGGVVASEA